MKVVRIVTTAAFATIALASTAKARDVSMTPMADILGKEHAEIWINHDKPQRESLKLAPAFYE
jgi:hypothetical protein